MQSPELNAANRTYHEAQSEMGLPPNHYVWTHGMFRPYLEGSVIELGRGADRQHFHTDRRPDIGPPREDTRENPRP